MKKAIVINDLSGFGKCSLTAAIPVLSVLGIQCVPLATAVLTGQTGYPYYHCTDLTDMMPLYIDAWEKNHTSFDAIYSGFLTGNEQVRHVMSLIDVFSRRDTFVLIDPVMGDNGHVYGLFTKELQEGMKKLVRKADMITPNLTEACLLLDENPQQLLSIEKTQDLISLAKDLANRLLNNGDKPKEIVITGIKNPDPDALEVYNLAVSEKGSSLTKSPYIGRSFSGTGDLFSSCMCGLRMNGYALPEAISITEQFLLASIRDSMEENTPSNDGIHFEKNLHLLIQKGVHYDQS